MVKRILQATLNYPDETSLAVEGPEDRVISALKNLDYLDTFGFLTQWAEDVTKGNMKGARAEGKISVNGCMFKVSIEPHELSEAVQELYKDKK